MLIRYSRKRLLPNLMFGCSFIVIGFLMVYKDPANFWRYGYFLIGLLYLGIWIFEKKNQYLLIRDGVLTKNKVKPKNIPLSEVNRIVKETGNITLYTQKDRLRVNTELIDKSSLENLHRILNNLEINNENSTIQKISFGQSPKQ